MRLGKSNKRTMIGFRLSASLIVGLSIGLIAVFGLRLLTVWMKGNGIWSVFLAIGWTALMASIGYLAGEISDGALVAIPLVIVTVVLCELSWYWWDYREFRIEVAKAEATQGSGQVFTDSDAFLTAEVGSSGFWGYLKWSALQGASIEDAPPIAPGNRAAIVNWGKRSLSMFWALVWCLLAFAHAKGSAESVPLYRNRVRVKRPL